jgi:hypothetical protein
MAVIHVVKPGECLTSIAALYHVEDAQKLYNDPANADLKAKRPNPNLLHPGDEVTIPDTAQKTYKLETDKRHKIVIKRLKRKLKVTVKIGSDPAHPSAPYSLVGKNFEVKGQTTSAGLVEQDVPADLRDLTLVIGRTRIALQLGHLNPMRDVPEGDVSGAQARLVNLGFAPGPIDGVLGPRTEAAIREFQASKGLEETGQLDDQVIDALHSEHGC